jgi:Uma2 family endonuclease
MTTVQDIPQQPKITVQQFREMDFPDNDFFIYELINGIIMKKTAPQPFHQDISSELEFALKTCLRQKPIGKMYHAPIDVFFDDNNQSQPDILFISQEREFIIDRKNGIFGAPDLIVEIISPGSIHADRVLKKDLYERFGVKEYWLIDPKNQTVEIFTFKNDRYQTFLFLEGEGLATSSILTDFEVSIAELFQ